jgi:flagellar biosynthesis protein
MNKRKLKIHPGAAAAALRYSQEKDLAPRLVAKGYGKVAEKIIEAAKEAGIPIREDPDLLSLLMMLNIDEMIPPELYAAVAELLAFVYRLNNRMPVRPAAESQRDFE